MKVRILRTPSTRIAGLPDPLPKEGEIVDLDNEIGLRLIQQNIAIPVEKKIRGQAKKPAIAETPAVKIAETEPDKKEES